jgi:hypothetical protein
VPAALFVLLVFGTPAPEELAAAPKKRIAVVANSINRPENDAELGAIAPSDEAASAASYALGLTIVAASEMLETKLGDQIRDCGAEVRCIAARLKNADVALALLIVADLGLRPPLVTARVVDAEREKVISTSIAEVSAGGLSLAVKTAAAKSLERAGFVIGGRLAIDTSPPSARVQIGHSSTPGTPNLFVVGAGVHEVSASHDGYTSTSTRALVRAGRDTRVWLELAPSESILGSPWFWVAVAGVALAAGGAVFFFAPGSGPRPLCQSRDGTCE